MARQRSRPLAVPLKESESSLQRQNSKKKGKSIGVSLMTSRLVSPQKDGKKTAAAPTPIKKLWMPKPRGPQGGPSERLRTLGPADPDAFPFRTTDRQDRNRLRNNFASSRGLEATPAAWKPKLAPMKPLNIKKKSKAEFTKLYRKHLQELADKVQRAKAAAGKAERQQRKAASKKKAGPPGVRTSCPSLVGIGKDMDAVSGGGMSNAASQRSAKHQRDEAEESFQTDLLASHKKEPREAKGEKGVQANPGKFQLPVPVVAARPNALRLDPQNPTIKLDPLLSIFPPSEP